MTDRHDNHLQALGNFIRAQRQLAQLTLRQLAELTAISNPYLSQLERGQHAPSIRILGALAEALNVPVDILLAQAGLAAEPSGTPRVEDAIRLDERLSAAQKSALIATYHSMIG